MRNHQYTAAKSADITPVTKWGALWRALFLTSALVCAHQLTTIEPIAPASADAVDTSAWQQKIGRHIAENLIYPRSAIRRGVEGSARVRLTIDATGKILKHEVTKESGQKTLDRTIEKIVAKMNPLPTPPAGTVSGSDMDIIIPLTWRLK